MRVNANAVLRSWTLLAAFGGSYAPDTIYRDRSPQEGARSRSSGERTDVYIYISIYLYIVTASPSSPQEGARSRSPQ